MDNPIKQIAIYANISFIYCILTCLLLTSCDKRVNIPFSLLVVESDSVVYNGNRLYPAEFNDLTIEKSNEHGIYICLEMSDTLMVVTYNTEVLRSKPFLKLSKKRVLELFENQDIEICPSYILITHGNDSIGFIHMLGYPWWSLNAAALTENNGLKIEPFIIGNNIRSVFNSLYIDDLYDPKYKFLCIIQLDAYHFARWINLQPAYNQYLSENFDMIIIEIDNDRICRIEITDFGEKTKKRFGSVFDKSIYGVRMPPVIKADYLIDYDH